MGRTFRRIKPPSRNRGIVTLVFMSVVFVVLVGITFWGVQWFSVSINSLLIHGNFAPASLELPIENAAASVEDPGQDGETDVQAPNEANAPPSLPSSDQGSTQSLQLAAKAAISVEIENGQPRLLFAKNEDRSMPIASLTKLMTAAVVFEHYDLSQKVIISQAAMDQEGEQGDLQLGQTLSVEDLLYIMLIESSNRAAYALAEYVGPDQFVAAMNVYAQDIGLSETHFADASGLNPDSYSSAKDLVSLTRYLFDKYPLFREIIGLKQYNLYLDDGMFHHTLVNTNELLGQDHIIGGKTGFTNEAKGCVMTIQSGSQQGAYIINVILGSDNRFKEMGDMIHWINAPHQP
jgi:D-alanyl-D-alanine carboxypeptidase